MGRTRLIKIEELSRRTKDATMYLVAHHGLMDLSINSISKQSEISENHIYIGILARKMRSSFSVIRR